MTFILYNTIGDPDMSVILATTQTMYRRMRQELPGFYAIAYPYLLIMLRELEGGDAAIALDTAMRRFQVAQRIINSVIEHEDESRAALAVHHLLPSRDLKNALYERARLITAQVTPHLVSTGIGLDFGCGRADVSARISLMGQQLILYDVTDYRCNEARRLPFFSHKDELSASFAFVMANLVFHHCDDPDAEIRWISEQAKRLIVIESVVNPFMPWAVIAFIDWVYNRCLEPNACVPVPGNYRTAEEWIQSAESIGFRLQGREVYGWDTLIVPEFHELLIFER